MQRQAALAQSNPTQAQGNAQSLAEKTRSPVSDKATEMQIFKSNQLSLLIIADGLLNTLPAIHHKRPTLHNRLF